MDVQEKNNMNDFHFPKTIVLVGMMGVGKTSVGKRLAQALKVSFRDSDQEVEQAARCTIADIYSWYGEQAFIDAERRVIQRLMDDIPHVLSTGVGAFTQEENRNIIKKNGFSIWLDASLETILPRVARRSHRPQLEQGNKQEILEDLMSAYKPHYEQADFRVCCDHQSPDVTVNRILKELTNRF
jgi:shikimate kinase